MLLVPLRCDIPQQTGGINHQLRFSDDGGIDHSPIDESGPASLPGNGGNDLLGPFDFLFIRAPGETPLPFFRQVASESGTWETGLG